jgi:site-specific DNA-cytosine methylase
LYWTNLPVEQPEDKGILLGDIIECGQVDREKSHCLDANYFKGGNLKTYFEKHRRQLVFGGAWRGRYNPDGSTSQQLELRYDNKTNSLTTVQKDNVAVYPKELQWRKLTVTECERLQTVPEGYTAHVSNTQRYKMLGNGMTVDVIAHILKGLDNA